MIEMEMENERVERLRLQHLGQDWIQAITGGAFEQLGEFCQPQVVSNLLTPKRFTTLEKSTDLVAKYRDWFDTCTNFRVEESRVDQVGERLGIFYRFHLQNQEDWFTIEQQLYCTLKDGLVEKLHLLCSGFQPVETKTQAMLADSPEVEQAPIPDDLLMFYLGASKNDSTCAVLTPMIRSKLREMQSGQVLEVRVNDPSAREDVEAWSRLSGNPLLKVFEEGQDIRFFVKKK